MAEATRPTTTELITYLDPRELIPNPRNPRTRQVRAALRHLEYAAGWTPPTQGSSSR